jgi:hypothetical protein
MKMKKFFLSLACFLGLTALSASAASLSQTIASINSDAQKEGGPAKVLASISKSTGVPVATLEKEKTTTGLSYGDIYAAHTVAKASGKSFNDIVALKKKGDSWDKIAADNGLATSKKEAAAAAAAPSVKPSPTPPKRRLADEMKDKWK